MAVRASRIRGIVDDLLATDAGRVRPLPVGRLARDQGIHVVSQAFEGDEDVSGFYLRQGEERVIGVNHAHPEVRRRFTIAHELGHALLHDGDGLHVDTAFRMRDVTSSMAIDPDEIAANRFAAELLMPAEEVRRIIGDGIDVTDDASLREVARHFGVSAQALVFRLSNLGVGLDGKARF